MQLEELPGESYLKQRWLRALLMWAKGPLSPVKKAMGSPEGKSCRKRKGKILLLNQWPCSEPVFFVVVF